MLFVVPKGSFRASFFITLFATFWVSSCAKADAVAWNETQWQALLHYVGGVSRIADPGFFVGGQVGDLQHEFKVAKSRLLKPKKKDDLVCKFPARQLWLSQQFSQPPADLSHCVELQYFLKKVPHQRVELVFSSENLASPSSMMGHILLKISGLDDHAQLRQHAISFYTQLDGLNIPKTIFDSLFVGKIGYFSLSPYRKKLDFYLNTEGRNVWEYELELTEGQIRLLMLHLWELKQAKLTYFFHSYNCATVTNLILATVFPRLLPKRMISTTPLDVIKRATKSGVVAQVNVIASQKWQARMLRQAATSAYADRAEQFIKTGDGRYISDIEDEKKRYVMLELSKHYLSILKQESRLPKPRVNNLDTTLAALENDIKESYVIDVSQFKIPTKTPADSQWSVGVVGEDSEIFGRFSFLPASHLIEDDNRQFFSENELKLGAVSILANKNTVKLDELSLYEIQSFIPHNKILGGLSGKLHIGLKRSFDSSLKKRSKFGLAGGLGKAIEPHQAMTFYGIVNAGVAYGKKTGFAYIAPEVGAIIRESNNFKSHLNVSYRWNEFNSKTGITTIRLTQSKFVSEKWGVFASYERVFKGERSVTNYSLKLKRYF